MLLYSQLITKHKEKEIPYSTLLETKEWNDCRETILIKYNNTCVNCGEKRVDQIRPIPELLAKNLKLEFSKSFKNIEQKFNDLVEKLGVKVDSYSVHTMRLPEKLHDYKNLDIHHQYYILSKLPWEYPDALMPLCKGCHQKEHEKGEIKVFEYSIEDTEYAMAHNCSRCGGLGVIDQYHYYKNGICFSCDGLGFVKK